MKFNFIMPIIYNKDFNQQIKNALNCTYYSVMQSANFVDYNIDVNFIVVGTDEKLISQDNIFYINANSNIEKPVLDRENKRLIGLKYVLKNNHNSWNMYLEAGDLISENFFILICEYIKNNINSKAFIFKSGYIKTEQEVLFVKGNNKKFYKNFQSSIIFHVNSLDTIFYQLNSLIKSVEFLVNNNINFIFIDEPIVCSLIDSKVSYNYFFYNETTINNITKVFQTKESIKSNFRLYF
ncbi:hypothetical protein [Campylobacter sp. RM12651]|uniref:hypothetical protein n=1 Tax=Campylobacter sp. RM12651 TaxID=1660079 RepID=UPI001EFB9225|nr:hypothetical protein [Campylobacter sp. RM12651]ULO03519.1 hypothetical protein AVBRAN_1061 [Campylobacter sp. RM12651]